MIPARCTRSTCGHELDVHEDGTGACSSCPCPEYEPACVYCGDEGVVVEGDAEVPCGQCFELD